MKSVKSGNSVKIDTECISNLDRMTLATHQIFSIPRRINYLNFNSKRCNLQQTLPAGTRIDPKANQSRTHRTNCLLACLLYYVCYSTNLCVIFIVVRLNLNESILLQFDECRLKTWLRTLQHRTNKLEYSIEIIQHRHCWLTFDWFLVGFTVQSTSLAQKSRPEIQHVAMCVVFHYLFTCWLWSQILRGT